MSHLDSGLGLLYKTHYVGLLYKTERLQKIENHQPRPPTVEIRNDTPTVENDPTEGIRGVQWK